MPNKTTERTDITWDEDFTIIMGDWYHDTSPYLVSSYFLNWVSCAFEFPWSSISGADGRMWYRLTLLALSLFLILLPSTLWTPHLVNTWAVILPREWMLVPMSTTMQLSPSSLERSTESVSSTWALCPVSIYSIASCRFNANQSLSCCG